MLAWMEQLTDDQIALLVCGGIFAVSFFSMLISTPLRNLFQQDANRRRGRMIAGQLPDASTAGNYQSTIPQEKAA